MAEDVILKPKLALCNGDIINEIVFAEGLLGFL